MSLLTARKQNVFDRVRARIEQRAAHRQLVRELATYRTPAQRAELDAMLDLGQLEQLAELRKIINSQRAAA